MSDVTYLAGKETSVRALLMDALNKCDGFELIILITKAKDESKGVGVGHSDGYTLEKVGMCAFATRVFTDDMFDE